MGTREGVERERTMRKKKELHYFNSKTIFKLKFPGRDYDQSALRVSTKMSNWNQLLSTISVHKLKYKVQPTLWTASIMHATDAYTAHTILTVLGQTHSMQW